MYMGAIGIFRRVIRLRRTFQEGPGGTGFGLQNIFGPEGPFLLSRGWPKAGADGDPPRRTAHIMVYIEIVGAAGRSPL